jgi:hypothetical protein
MSHKWYDLMSPLYTLCMQYSYMLVNPLGNTKKQGHMIIASMTIQKTILTVCKASHSGDKNMKIIPSVIVVTLMLGAPTAFAEVIHSDHP